jgi:hypothetical protein
LILESDIKNNNFYLKNYKDNFEERYHLNDRFRDVHFEIMSDHKLIVVLLKQSFHQILFWFNVFHDNMNNLIIVSNINFDQIKKVFKNIFINKDC